MPFLPEAAPAGARFLTHAVENQPPPLPGYDLFESDVALTGAVRAFDAGWAVDILRAQGRAWGAAHSADLGTQANRYPPELHTHGADGRRRDEVTFHPAWHAIMAQAMDHGIHCSAWTGPRPGAHVARAAAVLFHGQVENGSQCPITMTHAARPVVERAAATLPWLRDAWLPRMASRSYDAAFAPIEAKRSVLIGMGMTEKQGGSDLRTNSTVAQPDGTQPGAFRLVGHKWFFSAPMCDAFLVLAQGAEGPSCFFLPRFLPDGKPNALALQRLKDKLGNRSNASSEVEFQGAMAWPVGEPGRGISTILEMGTLTRLDCALGTAALMRQALTRALHHAGHRRAFGRSLADQPLMRNVLADLALESEAATWLAIRLARLFDADADADAQTLRRVLTPAVKFWVCRRGPAMAAEAMEALGGSGYIEDSVMPRIYREMPLNSIWEGSGNVICLDVLRALHRDGRTRDVLAAELAPARGMDAGFDRHVDGLLAALPRAMDDETQARALAARIALSVQAALLLRHAPEAVARAFCRARLPDPGAIFGTLPADCDMAAILRRADVAQ